MYNYAIPMIALLRGTLVEKHPNQAILEVGGVGYDVTIPISTFSQLPDTGVETKLRVYTHVREDIIALYGFLTRDEKNLFEKLIGVSGIGPGLAIKVLSGMAAADLLTAIRRNELDKLVRIPGVGKKTSERIVLELKDRLPRAPVVAAAGGDLPRYRGDGRELFYLSLDNKIMEVSIEPGPPFHAGAPAPLFAFHPVLSGNAYDVSPDGKQFLVNSLPADQGSPPLSLLVNWTSLLKP